MPPKFPASRSLLLTLFALLLCGLTLFSSAARAVSESDLLPPEQAFAAKVERQGSQLAVTLDVADGYYLYRDRTHFSTDPADLAAAPVYPEGKVKDDPFFGKQTVFLGTNRILLPLRPDAPQRFTLQIRLQGCAEVGVCYPPYTHTIKVGEPPASGLSDWLAPRPAGDGQAALDKDNWPATLAAFFVAGIGMAFTACLYPLLPILSSLIAGQGATLTRGRGFALSMAYVQGLAASYTAVGVVAGLTGSLLTVWLQQPAVVLTASLLMVVFALGMFDILSIQLPSALQTRLADTSNRLPGGQALTVFLMGVLSALIIGPCVAPPLALALGYIGSTGDAVLGGAALYAMALGLGLPLIVVGTFGGHVLPRAGNWMKGVKAAFGVLMLGLAIWLASPFLPAALVLALWAALFIGSAVFLRAFEPLPGNAVALKKLSKALGLALFLIGIAQLVGALSGARDPLRPLQGLVAGSQAAEPGPAFVTVKSGAELDAQLQAAAGRPVLVDFYADWCVACKELESRTFPDPQVAAQLAGFALLRVDVTANTPDQQAMLKRYGLFGPPALILLDRKGQEADRVIGFIDPAPLSERLQRIQG